MDIKNPTAPCTCCYTHSFNGPFSGTTQVGRYQKKGKTNLDFTEARDNERQWHQLGHMQVCTSLQTDNQQCQSTATLPCETLMSAKQAINDKLQGSYIFKVSWCC